MASTFMMSCVKRNFLFLLSGIGKGLFNMFIGTLLFLNHDTDGKTGIWNMLMGGGLIASGLCFIFLAKIKNMSDDDMTRALSVYADADRAAAQGAASSTWNNHKDEVKGAAVNAAVNNKDVIAQVARDNKEVVGQIAYDNKEVIAQAYINNQNNNVSNY